MCLKCELQAAMLELHAMSHIFLPSIYNMHQAMSSAADGAIGRL